MTASAWSKAAGAVMGWRTASGRFGAIAQSNYATATANTATHKSGMFFTMPAGWGSTFQLIGLNLNGKIGAAAGSAKVGVWDTSGNELQSTTLDSDFTGSVGQTVNSGQLITFSNSTLATLSYGTKYYCGLEVISGTCIMTGIVLAEAADASAWPNGTNRGLMTYDGAFHETATTLPLCELIFADTTPGGGGASAVLYGQEGLRLL
jgi:hypothetical protein